MENFGIIIAISYASMPVTVPAPVFSFRFFFYCCLLWFLGVLFLHLMSFAIWILYVHGGLCVCV